MTNRILVVAAHLAFILVGIWGGFQVFDLIAK
jgi:hypothetical protein